MAKEQTNKELFAEKLTQVLKTNAKLYYTLQGLDAAAKTKNEENFSDGFADLTLDLEDIRYDVYGMVLKVQEQIKKIKGSI